MNLTSLINRTVQRFGLQLVDSSEIDRLRSEAQYHRDRNTELAVKLNRKMASTHYWRTQCEQLRKETP